MISRKRKQPDLDLLVPDKWKILWESIPSFPAVLISLVIEYTFSAFTRSHSTEVYRKQMQHAFILAAKGEQLLIFGRNWLRSYIFENHDLKQVEERKIDGMDGVWFLRYGRVDSTHQYLHLMVVHEDMCSHRWVYSLDSGRFIGKYSPCVNEEYLDFCLDQTGKDVFYIKKVRTPRVSSLVLEKVDAISNRTLCEAVYKKYFGSRRIIFEADGSYLYLSLVQLVNGKSSTHIDCVDLNTLQYKMKIEVPLPFKSGIMIDNFLFFHGKKIGVLYKYDLSEKALTTHCDNIPPWTSWRCEWMQWRDFLVHVSTHTGTIHVYQ